MNDTTAISLHRVSKMFKVYSRPTDMIREFVTRHRAHTEFWALEDISFEVRCGEAVGIIGRNGAGKSTLLKVIAGLLQQTAGDVRIAGRVSAILELGTGFHPAYTGRENIYMAGLCLGMSRKEIDEKLDGIIAFSGLADVVDQALRTYSSGMQGRLAFSTAISIDPDIVIIDEGLAVGDVQFQRKCFAKFEEMKTKNKTVLFVSHDQNAINHLCNRAIWLEHGRLIEDGEPRDVNKKYYKALFASEQRGHPDAGATVLGSSAELHEKGDQCEVRYGNQFAVIVDFGILSLDNKRVSVLYPGEVYHIFQKIRFNRDLRHMSFGLRIVNVKGVDVFAANSAFHGQAQDEYKTGDVVEVRFVVTNWLGPGEFFLTFGVMELKTQQFCDRRVDALRVTVEAKPGVDPVCLVNLNETVSVTLVSSDCRTVG